MDKPVDQEPQIQSSPKRYKVGTLVYTQTALFYLLFWMFGGSFCLGLMEQLQTVIPLQLKWEGAGDKTIGFISGSLMAIITVIINPVVGMKSDRHRGPLGRRRPFLLWYTPLIFISLVLLGYSKPISNFLYETAGLSGIISKPGLTILLIGIFSGLFYYFNVYIMQVYQYLLADVVPQELMGRFIGLYRAITALSIFVFNYYLFGRIEQYTQIMYVSLALIYAVAFLLLVWQVKEGQYPPPDTSARKKGFFALLGTYARECFTIPFYLKLYSVALFFWASMVPFSAFLVFYATDPKNPDYAAGLGLSLDAFGKIRGWTFLIQIPLYFIVGPFIDRFHPLRVVIVGLVGLCVTYLLGFFLINNETTLLVLWLINSVGLAVFLAAYLALFPRLLPQAKYGQFFSANQIFFCAGLITSPFLCGWFLELIRNYKYIFVWSGFFAILSLWLAILTYRHWLRLGGDKNYTPPEKTS